MSGSRTIYYWDGVVGNESLYEQYADLIAKLLSGDTQSVTCHKLSNGLYSAYADGKDRLIFTEKIINGKNCIVLLKGLPDHKYTKINVKALKRYVEQNSDIFDLQLASQEKEEEIAWEEISAESLLSLLGISREETSSPLEFKKVKYFNKSFVSFNVTQDECEHATFPLVISGPPGSGKSLVSLSLLINDHPDDRVLYVAKSLPLVNEMREQWKEMCAEMASPPKNVEFKTNDELVTEVISELKNKVRVGEEEFIGWIKGYFKNKKNIFKKDGVEDIANKMAEKIDALYQELKNTAIHTKEKYLALGERQSIFKKEEREFVWRIHTAYSDSLKSKNQVDINFYVTKLKALYKRIIVDEAQDLSYAQLMVLYQLAEELGVCMDSHQNLVDYLSKRPFILQMLGNDVTHIQLPTAYRCTQLMLDVLNEWMRMGYQAVGGLSDSDEYSVITLSGDQPKKANVTRYSADYSCIPEMVNELRKEYGLHEIAIVIADESMREEAIELYGTKQVSTVADIKGLEYKAVIVHRLFEKEECKELNARLQESTGNVKENINRPKNNNSRIDLSPFVCEVFTALSRATEELIIFQEDQHDIALITERLKNKIPKDYVYEKPKEKTKGKSKGKALRDESVTFSYSELTEEESEGFLRNVIRSLKTGEENKIKQAHGIYTQTLKHTQAEFEELAKKYKPKSSAVKSAEPVVFPEPVLAKLENVSTSSVSVSSTAATMKAVSKSSLNTVSKKDSGVVATHSLYDFFKLIPASNLLLKVFVRKNDAIVFNRKLCIDYISSNAEFKAQLILATTMSAAFYPTFLQHIPLEDWFTLDWEEDGSLKMHQSLFGQIMGPSHKEFSNVFFNYCQMMPIGKIQDLFDHFSSTYTYTFDADRNVQSHFELLIHNSLGGLTKLINDRPAFAPYFTSEFFGKIRESIKHGTSRQGTYLDIVIRTSEEGLIFLEKLNEVNPSFIKQIKPEVMFRFDKEDRMAPFTILVMLKSNLISQWLSEADHADYLIKLLNKDDSVDRFDDPVLVNLCRSSVANAAELMKQLKAVIAKRSQFLPKVSQYQSKSVSVSSSKIVNASKVQLSGVANQKQDKIAEVFSRNSQGNFVFNRNKFIKYVPDAMFRSELIEQYRKDKTPFLSLKPHLLFEISKNAEGADQSIFALIYAYPGLNLLIKSALPLFDSSKMNELFHSLCKPITIKVKTITIKATSLMLMITAYPEELALLWNAGGNFAKLFTETVLCRQIELCHNRSSEITSAFEMLCKNRSGLLATLEKISPGFIRQIKPANMLRIIKSVNSVPLLLMKEGDNQLFQEWIEHAPWLDYIAKVYSDDTSLEPSAHKVRMIDFTHRVMIGLMANLATFKLEYVLKLVNCTQVINKIISSGVYRPLNDHSGEITFFDYLCMPPFHSYLAKFDWGSFVGLEAKLLIKTMNSRASNSPYNVLGLLLRTDEGISFLLNIFKSRIDIARAVVSSGELLNSLCFKKDGEVKEYTSAYKRLEESLVGKEVIQYLSQCANMRPGNSSPRFWQNPNSVNSPSSSDSLPADLRLSLARQ